MPSIPRIVVGFVLLASCSPAPSRPRTRASQAVLATFDANPAVNGVLEPAEIEPPPIGWWEAERPCPNGTSLVVIEGSPLDREHPERFALPSIHCSRPDGRKHGPSTAFTFNGDPLANAYFRDGHLHGKVHSYYDAKHPDDVDVSVYDEGVGIGTWRTVHHDTVTVTEHRGEGVIYKTEHEKGKLVEEGMLVDGLRHGRWIFGDGAHERIVEYDRGKTKGSAALTGIDVCDAFVDRWLRCLQTKKGAERYEMASLLALIVSMWDSPVLAKGRDGPICVTHARNTADQFDAHACPP